ncbi:MAG: TraR/DksA C4-type zinc finger protein [Deltaproteobacteria bacterium]|nr:TraR/DksA C4-type zinc finger protein [Deltaproteobacteria bacterium]MCL5277962.1 TraR/DksA C4-type zinc finger protein [Deltaproteobacteria bacterium]
MAAPKKKTKKTKKALGTAKPSSRLTRKTKTRSPKSVAPSGGVKSGPKAKSATPKVSTQRREASHVEYEHIKQMLLKMKADIIDQLVRKKSSMEEEKTIEIEDLDAIAEDRNREYEYLLTTMDTKKLKQIDEALAKIENKTYGVCEVCGEEIPVARLKILPFAKLCIDCASNVEKEEALKQSLESEKDIFTTGNNEEENDIE